LIEIKSLDVTMYYKDDVPLLTDPCSHPDVIVILARLQIKHFCKECSQHREPSNPHLSQEICHDQTHSEPVHLKREEIYVSIFSIGNTFSTNKQGVQHGKEKHN
jgi:hypothetical protein